MRKSRQKKLDKLKITIKIIPIYFDFVLHQGIKRIHRKIKKYKFTTNLKIRTKKINETYKNCYFKLQINRYYLKSQKPSRAFRNFAKFLSLYTGSNKQINILCLKSIKRIHSNKCVRINQSL